MFAAHTASLDSNFYTPSIKSDKARAALNAGLSIWQIIELVIEFGPTVLDMIPAIMAVFKAHGGVTLAAIEGLISEFGPEVYAIIQAVATLFGVTDLPPAPVVPTEPTPAAK